jgi:hypothetical protein
MEPGDVVEGRFTIERFVRSGAMGAVYRAGDGLTGAPVALKVVLGAMDPEGEVRFEREAQTLAELDHPGIVRYVAHGNPAPGPRYLAMEWIEGEDLEARLARGPLTVDETLALGLRVAEALAAAHGRGAVHRDLKPSNILLAGGAPGQAKIVDFGLAALPDASRATQTGTVVGTPAYLAPERAEGNTELDPRADVFALGAILHECLTGKPTFAGRHVMAVLAKIVFEQVPSLRDLGLDVPAALDSLIGRMLAKAPAARPAGGGALAEALAALCARSARPSRSPASPAGASLTRAEQRVVCLVMARGSDERAPARDERAPERTLRAAGVPTPRGALPAVDARGGRAQVLADGTLVVTIPGARLAVDQAAAAAGCALQLRAALPGWAVAVTTGRAEVEAERAVGDAIDRAAAKLRARLRRPAPDDAGIDLDDVTAGLLDLRFDVTAGALGLSLSGERDVAESARTLLGRPTPFVGRDREMAMLQALLPAELDEPGAQAVLVTGPVGVGKSRLRHELVERLRARGGVEIWIARGDPMRAGAPFGLLAQLLRRTARLVVGEPVEVGRQKLLARVSRYVPAPERLRVAEFLGELLGVPFPDEGRVQLRAARQDPRLQGDQMRRAWVDLLDAEAGAQPLVLVLEDLHWGDAPSAEYVGAALRLLRERPLFVLALGRPEVHGWLPWRDGTAHEVRLGELSPRACERLARAVLGEGVEAAAVARLCERSAGNAFFLEELLRAAAEGRDGARLDTMLAMVESRLDALGAEERRVLRAASVFGKVFWRGALLPLLGGEAWLARLEEREWIVRRPAAKFQGEDEYAFQHALVRDAAYGMLTEEDRALGHRLAGAWLEAAGETDAQALAEHFERGGAAADAVRWSCAAAEQALEGDDLPAVLARVDRAVALGAQGEALGRLSLARAVAHHWRGEHAEAEPWAAQAAASLPRGSARWGAAREATIWAAGGRGDGEGVARAAAELLALPASAEARVTHVVALTRAVSWLVQTGHYDRARAIERAVTPLVEALRDEPVAQAAAAVARVYLAQQEDDPLARRELLSVAIGCFEDAGDRRQACLQRINLAAVCNQLGAYAEARSLAGAAAAEAERLGVAFAVRVAQSNLGPALSRSGASAEAVGVLRAAIDGAVESGDHFTAGVTRLYLAEALLGGGELVAAEAEARAALPVLAAFRPYACLAQAQLAAVLLAQGSAGAALSHAGAASAALASLGRIDEGEALVRVVYAEALHASGAPDAARAAIAAARERLLADAARLHDGALRQQFLGAVPDHARTLALAARWLERPA